MTHEGEPVAVNFARAMPVFPLDGVVLLPHATIRLYIFEPRYRQMVSDAMDSAGQIAMAVFDGDKWREDYSGTPPIRPAVCVSQIVHHEGMSDGTAKIWIRGVCRARIIEEHDPEGERLYRTARLVPSDDPDSDALATLDADAIPRLIATLRQEPLAGLPAVRAVVDQLESHEGGVASVSPTALLDVISLGVLAGLGDRELLYDILDRSSPADRCEIVLTHLGELASILRVVGRQYDEDAPSGISWN